MQNEAGRRIIRAEEGKAYGTERKAHPQAEGEAEGFYLRRSGTLLGYLEFIRSNKGRTSGSRVMFSSPEHGTILLHKPHPQKELKGYQVKQLVDFLEQEGLI